MMIVTYEPVAQAIKENCLKSRKRKRKEGNWKQNKRLVLRQSGKEHDARNGAKIAARVVRTVKNCTRCRFKCSEMIHQEYRQHAHSQFWRLTDNEKRHYFSLTTERKNKKRIRGEHQSKSKKTKPKAYSYSYYVYRCENKIRVCKTLYLITINISQKRVVTHHKTKDSQSGVPHNSKQGKHVKRSTSCNDQESVRDHINSYPRVESHYCRADSKREYLEVGLTVTRMYDMFCEQRSAQRSRNGLEDEIENVKIHTYRRIFCNEFNIAFQMPKKDRCDLCEEFQNKVNPQLEVIAINSTHIAGKEATKEDCDKNRPIQDNTHAIICFDLQNVISLPRVNVSSFFYRRKFNVYNLTAHCSLGRDGYCAIWSEGMSKRTGNDIASALAKILSSISDCHPEINKMTLWSESCVAQKKSSVNSFAINHFYRLRAARWIS